MYFCDYDYFIVAYNFLVLCLSVSLDDVGLVCFNKEKPWLFFCSNPLVPISF